MIDIDRFLSRYKELCEEFGVIINSCGCCDSPFIRDSLDPLPEQLDHLREGFFTMYAPKEVMGKEYPPPPPVPPATPEQIQQWEKEDEEQRTEERGESLKRAAESLTLIFSEDEDV